MHEEENQRSHSAYSFTLICAAISQLSNDNRALRAGVEMVMVAPAPNLIKGKIESTCRATLIEGRWSRVSCRTMLIARCTVVTLMRGMWIGSNRHQTGTLVHEGDDLTALHGERRRKEAVVGIGHNYNACVARYSAARRYASIT